MRLRYHAPEFKPTTTQRTPGHPAPAASQPQRLVFPRQALDEARSHRALAIAGRTGPRTARRSGDIIANLEAELDFMSESVATLAEDVSNFKFPSADEDYLPPSAA